MRSKMLCIPQLFIAAFCMMRIILENIIIYGIIFGYQSIDTIES